MDSCAEKVDSCADSYYYYCYMNDQIHYVEPRGSLPYDYWRTFEPGERVTIPAALTALHEAAKLRKSVVRHKIKFVEAEQREGRATIRCMFPNYFPRWAERVLDEFYGTTYLEWEATLREESASKAAKPHGTS